jgi:hypothetical protein
MSRRQGPIAVRKDKQGDAYMAVRPVSCVGEVVSLPLAPTARSALPSFASSGVENSA